MASQRPITLEVCCGSFADALAAQAGGAPRIELNSALPLGGLTPSEASVKLVRQHTSLEVVAMVRPCAGGFCYTNAQWSQLLAEISSLLAAGAHGIAFGCLTPTGTIDVSRTSEAVNLIHQAHATAVFHRAFDLTPDADKAINQLVSLGVDRLLTSGQAPTALEGAPLIAHLQSTWGDRIEILPGSGIRPSNAAQLLATTGVSQLHSSCTGIIPSPAAATAAHGVNFSVPGYAVDTMLVVDEAIVQDMVNVV
ncbi:copper homeostasis protein CutC [Olsenella sp. KGMB02461]|nr:copper homeostasis protein CutC [Olsenella sp. KGMB02461]